MSKIILFILVLGIIYKVISTANGNFLFNMDSARDFVDVREMVELKKLRLTGPTTPIAGLYDGPLWYYFLAIGYVVSNGDPYSAILMQIALWAIGGYFLLKLVKNINFFLVAPIGFIWVASNYLALASLYSFNPTPVTFLAPLFVYLLVEYLRKENPVYGICTWGLAGLFFNFEMNFGVFAPIIIFLSIILTNNLKLLRQKWFWLGVGLFVVTLLPQIIFDFKHQFIMSKAILRHLSDNSVVSLNMIARFQTTAASFYNTFVPTLMNNKLLTWIIIGLLFPVLITSWKEVKKDKVVIVSLIFVFVPFIGYLFLPVTVNSWHLGGEMAVSLILLAFLLKKLKEGNIATLSIFLISVVLILASVLSNIANFFLNDFGKPSLDPSRYNNEIAAIDYVYQKAGGQNFKVYTYLPSIYDYPYQYLFWWYGLKRFGYLPVDYAYAPDKPVYISNKPAFSAPEEQIKKRQNSNLIFLIKEPDRNYTRSGWEGDFYKLKSIEKRMVGSIEIDVRQDFN